MVDDPEHSPGHLVRVAELLGVTSDVNDQVDRAGAEDMLTQTRAIQYADDKIVFILN